MKATNNTIYLEGNGGGDNVSIEILNDGRIHLKVGHCCVYTVDHFLPVEWLSTAITKVVIDSGGVEEIIKKSGWPKEFTDELYEKIEPYALNKIHNRDQMEYETEGIDAYDGDRIF